MIFYHLLRSMRPRQWIKNLVVFAAIIFGGQLFFPQKFWPVFNTFLILNFMASGVYIINDIVDINRDKLHYFKKNRPIAKGLIKPNIAIISAIILIIISLFSSYFLSRYLFLLLATFLVIQVLYSLYLKNIIILDIITIAATFMIRIFAGFMVVASSQPVTSLSSLLILTNIINPKNTH